MVGIKSYGVYIPFWRLDLGSIKSGRGGEKAIANFDEDSLTMGVAAARNCLNGVELNTVDGLFFASSTFPYKEKQVSVIAATALDLRTDIITADFANSLRAGTNALRAAMNAIMAGQVRQVLVIAADMRLATPGSDLESYFGDGAVALLLASENFNVAIKDSSCVIDEVFDIWRTDDDKFVRSWEDRFNIEEGYLKIMPKAITKLMQKNQISPEDFAKAVFYAPTARRHKDMGMKLGFTPEQLQPPIFGSVGDTGSASCLMILAGALDAATPGDKVLLANYGNGADAFLLEVIRKNNFKPSLSDYINSKVVIKDYIKYLHWRGLVEYVTGRRRPPTPSPSVTCLWREVEQNLRLHGVKCRKCGMVQYPPQLVCFNCHTKGEFEPYRLGDKPAKLVTYAEDMATPTPNPPLVLAVLDFEGGGRLWAYLTDKGTTEMEIGMPLHLTFRKLFTNEGIHNYAWKCMPPRFTREE